MADWTQTQLWKKLQNADTAESKNNCIVLSNENFLPKIQKILAKGETAISDFTLHDEDHSFRVAELMIKVIPSETLEILSEYELMLLLLSAYLHDIGMTPSLSKVKAIQEILIDGKSINLSETERKKLQHWLDEQDSDFELGVDKYLTENFEGHKNLFQTIKYYCRERHNDWSGEWIDENLKDIKIGNYTNWHEDLKNVCKSHHYGFTDLMNSKFDALPIENQVVNLRYLALCLRMADVLENDPERTPDVIFQHREVSKDSTIYWYKDHSFSIDIRHDAPIAIYARPKSAFIHKAVLDTASQIETELKLCQDIFNSEKINNSLTKRFRKEYKWTLQSYISKTIEPLNNQYEFIEGYFRPKIAKVLELLGGEQLYGNTNSAVRELIQNAFDATRIQIAYEIVKNESLTYEEWALKLGEKYPVKIKLEKDEIDNYWLICEDKGIGMSKRIITDYLLVTGASKSNEISELERECRKKGFELERTGQFGIGVLSYFMIADQIIFTTKRSELSSEEDREAWQFTVHGIGDFGELKKVNKPIHGTEIRLRLKKELFEEYGYQKWEEYLGDYIKRILIRNPCSLKTEFLENEVIEFKTGWTLDISEKLKNDNIVVSYSSLAEFSKYMRSDLDESDIEKIYHLEKKIFQGYLNGVKFLSKEGNLPNNYGKYLIYFPYYELKKGNSLVYVFEDLDTVGFYERKNMYKKYQSNNRFTYGISWKGISISTNLEEARESEFNISSKFNFSCLFDFTKQNKGKSIGVSRDWMEISEDLAWEIQTFIEGVYQSMISESASLFRGEYSYLSFLECHNKEVLTTPFKMYHSYNNSIKFDICEDEILINPFQNYRVSDTVTKNDLSKTYKGGKEIKSVITEDLLDNSYEYDFDIAFKSNGKLTCTLQSKNICEVMSSMKMTLTQEDLGLSLFSVLMPDVLGNISLIKKEELYRSGILLIKNSIFKSDSYEIDVFIGLVRNLIYTNQAEDDFVLSKEDIETIKTKIVKELFAGIFVLTCYQNFNKNELGNNIFFEEESIRDILKKYEEKYILIIQEDNSFLVSISDFTAKEIANLEELERVFGMLKEENKYYVEDDLTSIFRSLNDGFSSLFINYFLPSITKM